MYTEEVQWLLIFSLALTLVLNQWFPDFSNLGVFIVTILQIIDRFLSEKTKNRVVCKLNRLWIWSKKNSSCESRVMVIMGVANLEVGKESDFSKLILKADKALYAAK